MKIGMRQLVGMGLLASLGALGGCATPAEGGDDQGLASLVDDEAGGVKAAGETYTLNCGASLPGFPKPPCNPDLTWGQTATQIVAPGGQLAPGHYIGFKLVNNANKAAGPFVVKVLDQTGAVLQTVSYSGLAAYGTSILTVYAPYSCGWSRKVVADANGTVLEAAEYNNETTQSYPCTRAL